MRQLWDCIFTECTVCTQLDISPTSWSLRKLCTLFDHPRVGGGLSHIKQTCQNTSAGRSPSWLFCQFSWTDEWTALFFVNTNILFCKRFSVSNAHVLLILWYTNKLEGRVGGTIPAQTMFLAPGSFTWEGKEAWDLTRPYYWSSSARREGYTFFLKKKCLCLNSRLYLLNFDCENRFVAVVVLLVTCSWLRKG